jgi:hypothetical protein
MKAPAILLFFAFAALITADTGSSRPTQIAKDRIMGGYRSTVDSSLLTLHISPGADSGSYTRIDVRSKSTEAGKWSATPGSPVIVTLVSKSSRQSLAVTEDARGMHLRSHPSGPANYIKISGPGAK